MPESPSSSYIVLQFHRIDKSLGACFGQFSTLKKAHKAINKYRSDEKIDKMWYFSVNFREMDKVYGD